MSPPPAEKRSTANLQQEVKNLRNTYAGSAKALGPYISEEAAKALDKINDAIEVLEKELSLR